VVWLASDEAQHVTGQVFRLVGNNLAHYRPWEIGENFLATDREGNAKQWDPADIGRIGNRYRFQGQNPGIDPQPRPQSRHTDSTKIRGFETIAYDEGDDGVAVVTLNRPDVHNAFNSLMQREVRSLWRALRRHDDVRCIVLTGAGDKAFCTGIDRMEQMGGEHDDTTDADVVGSGS